MCKGEKAIGKQKVYPRWSLIRWPKERNRTQ